MSAPREWTEAVEHYRAGRLVAAEASCRALLRRVKDQPDALGLLAAAVQGQGRLAEAEGLFERVTALQPGQPRAWNNLGNSQAEQGKREAAEASYRRALALQPDYAVALKNLGQTLRELGRGVEAEACYRRAVDAQPDYAEAHLGLGVTLSGLGRMPEAVAALRQAIAVRPDFAEAYNNLGNALRRTGDLDAALAAYEKAIALRPDFAEAYSNLGFALRDRGRLAEAEERCRAALRLRPDYAEAHVNLGLVLQDRGRVDAAVGAFHDALARNPNHRVAHSNLIFALDCAPGGSFSTQQEERRRWWERHGRRHAPTVLRHGNVPDPERRLRIGYVSADFKRHSAAYCFGPILRCHDRTQFDVICYSGVASEDETTAAFRRLATQWRPSADLDDDALAERIRADSIDILVDLSGHSAGNRLLVFARKPAPVQVTAWGHANGTGLAAVDYLFSDPRHIPPSVRPLFAETVWDLPCLIAYEAPADAPDVGPLPARANGFVTLGCFNRVVKITEPALALWARILDALPHARMIFKDGALSDAGTRDYIVGTLARHGVEPGRVELRGGTPQREHLRAFGDVDIALDPFPQNGGISSYDALWMGVPVVTMAGDSGPSRVTAAILSAVGHPEWVAASADDYATLVLRRAANPEELAVLRSTLRGDVARSTAGDPLRYTRAVEDAYRAMWRRWCEGRT